MMEEDEERTRSVERDESMMSPKMISMRKILNDLERRCQYCWVMDVCLEVEHSFKECRRMDEGLDEV